MGGVDLLVIGGTGLLGSTLVDLADRRGVDWAATFHTTHRFGGRWRSLDLADGDSVRRTLDELCPSAVINAAYVPSGPDLDPITGDAPAHIAEWTSANGTRFVQLSTDLVFDGELGRPYAEGNPPNPVNDYGRAKAAAEAGVAAADADAVIVRTSLLWGGPGDGGPQVRLVQNPDVSFFTDEYRNPLDVVSLAEACLELTERPEITGVLHVAGPDRVDRLTFARALAPLAGVDPASLRGASGTTGPGRAADTSLDSSRAETLLSTELRGLPTA